ncbi:MAG: hypothetical protein WC489_07350 [Patescibacteria group bacterium]|jgi:hypothetical protein
MTDIPPGDETPESSFPRPGEEVWDDLEDKELEAYVQEHESKLDSIKSFLTIADKQHKIVTFTDGKETIRIKVRAAIPYETRERQQKLHAELMEMWEVAKEKAEKLGLDPDKVQLSDLKLQRPMYEILAELCIEPPWNDWRTWAVIDRGVKGQIKGSGYGPVMLQKIFETISDTKKDIKSFRGLK